MRAASATTSPPYVPMKSRFPLSASEPLIAPCSCAVQRVRPVVASSAQTRPFQSPTKTVPRATSGDDSVGPIRRSQRRVPVARVERRDLAVVGVRAAFAAADERLVDDVAASAGEAQPQRPER